MLIDITPKINKAAFSLEALPLQKISKLTFTMATKNGRRCFTIEGRRVAQTLIALKIAGSQGITAAEVSCWAYRLASYVHKLRHEYGLDIVTHKEEHEGGWHARYEMLSDITIIEAE